MTLNVGNPGTSGDTSSAETSSTDGQLTVFDGATGKAIEAYNGAAGLVKTNASGVASPATPGTDYVVPGGNVATATALAANPGNCSTGESPLGITAGGVAEGCFDVATQGELDTHSALTNPHSATALNTASRLVLRDASGNFAAGTITATLSGNASTASALAANGSNCGAGQAPLGVNAAGAAEGCFSVVTNSVTLTPDLPVIGAGGSSVALGSISGTTTRFGTVATSVGSQTSNKQVMFDSAGNLIASAFDVGAAGGGTAAWGNITGTLSAQTDLQAVLDAKLDDSQLSTDTTLGVGSNSLLPTQGAVQTFVNTGLATKQATLSPGNGIQMAGATIATASTEANFLTQGIQGTSDLTAGAGNGGKLQTLDTGRLQYTAGTTPSLWSGYLLPSPFSYSLAAGTCTGDGNGGKLTINGSNQVVCAADQGGAGGSGTVTSITATAPIQVTGGEITTAGDISIVNAAADGSTKGAASFNANDFNATSGNISLDYTNAQAASSSTKGFLTAADWTTFNNKQDALGFTAVPNTRTVNGHALSADVTVTKSDVSLGNVTNDAQLKRAGNDWSGFTQKATPTTSDLLLIEDAGDSLNKKYVTIGNLPGFALTVTESDDDPSVSNVTEIRITGGSVTDETGGVVTINTSAGGGGDVFGPASSATGEIALFGDATGKNLTRATGSGLALLTSGVLSTVTAPTGAVVGDTDAMVLSGKDVSLRMDPVTSGDTFPCNIASSDICVMNNTELADEVSFPAPGGTPRNEQRLEYRISCTNAQTYSFDAVFHFPGDVTQPLGCTAGTTDRIKVAWNDEASRYDVLAVIQDSGTGGSSSGPIIQDEGVDLPSHPRLNITGAGATCAENVGTGAIDCNIPGVGGSAYDTLQDEGTTSTPARSVLNVVGGSLALSDDAGNNRKNLTLSQSPAGSTAVVGTTRILTMQGTANQVNLSATAQDLSADRTWTFSIPASAQLSVAKLTNLTTNGVVTTTGGDGTLAVATNVVRKYVTTFTGQTTVTVAGATHGLGTADMLIQCWDAATPRQLLPVVDATVDPTNSNEVVISFTNAQSGRCILEG